MFEDTNDLLLYIDYIWKLYDRMLRFANFCTLQHYILSGDDKYFQYLNLYKKEMSPSFFFYFFLIPLCDTQAYFQIKFRLYVPDWMWNKFKNKLTTVYSQGKKVFYRIQFKISLMNFLLYDLFVDWFSFVSWWRNMFSAFYMNLNFLL